MKKKKQVNAYVSDGLYKELSYFAERYKVSPAYVLQVAYKICDRRVLEKVLSLELID